MPANRPDYELILATITDGVVVVDNAGVVLFANQSAEQIFERNTLLHSQLAIPLAPSQDFIQINIVRKSGLGWAEFRSSPINWEGRIAYLITVRDITEQKNIAIELQASEEKQRTILQAMTSNVVILNADGLIEYINHASPGLDEKDVIGSNWLSWIDKEDKPLVIQTLNHVLASGEACSIEYRALGPARQMTWFQVSFAKMPGNSTKRVVLIATDITERKQSELALHKSDMALRKAQKVAHVGSWNWNTQTNQVEWSDEMFSLFGIDKANFSADLDYIVSHAIHPEDRSRVELANRSVIEEGNPQPLEYRIVRPDGTIRIVWAEAGESIRDETGKVLALSGIVQDITERKRIEETLRESERNLRLAQEIANLGSWEYDLATSRLQWSEELFRIFGVSPATFTPTLDSLIGLIHPDDKSAMQAWLASCVSGKNPEALRFRCVLPDGTQHIIEYQGTLKQNAQGTSIGVSGTGQDISERIQIESSLRIAATAFESQEGMIIADANGTILRVNQAFTTITGYSADEVIGKNPSILQSGRQSAAFYQQMWEHINQTGGWEGEIWNKRKNGEIYPEHLTITAVRNQEGEVSNYVGTLTDITMSKAASEQIHRLAFFDGLTDLPNRRLLQDRLEQAFAVSARKGNFGALLFIDLDNFKTLNDTLGHDIGDIFLKQIANRLSSSVRVGDTVARFGGDEFLVMLEDLGEREIEAAKLTEIIGNKILNVLSQPYFLGSHQYHSTCSIGATLFYDHKATMDQLLKQSDIALYEAKNSGRGKLCFFDPKMQASISIRADLENELRNAIKEQQFQLYYQIQVDGSQNALGAEVLIRWIHPNRGIVPPAQFIPLAEDTGLIFPIGQWVLESACAQLEIWQNDSATRNLTIAVNVSARQFRQDDFVATVKKAMQQYDFDPHKLKLELTESLLLANVEDVIAKMNELKMLGIQFSLDDFGTGYSSLQYLKRLPLDQLKIDQSFVRDIFIDNSDQAIVRTIIVMAQTLNLGIIAEGVETDEQRLLLMGQGCTDFQGYLFGRPVPHDQFLAMLKKSDR